MSQLLKNLLTSFVHPDKTWRHTLLEQWHDIVGDLGTKVHLEKIYEDTLVLSVDSASWLQELYLLSDVLREQINNRLDKPRITTLRFKSGTNKVQTIVPPSAPTRSIAYQKRPLTSSEKETLVKVNDLELRAALETFLYRCSYLQVLHEKKN